MLLSAKILLAPLHSIISLSDLGLAWGSWGPGLPRDASRQVLWAKAAQLLFREDFYYLVYILMTVLEIIKGV